MQADGGKSMSCDYAAVMAGAEDPTYVLLYHQLYLILFFALREIPNASIASC